MQISRPVLLVLAAMAAFGMMALFTREANAPVLTVAAWRAILVAVAFGVWAYAREGGASALRPDRKTLRLAVPYGIALAVASSTFVGGYAMTTVANTIFLHNLAPVVVFPLAWWLHKERPDASAIAGAGVALLGVAMLSGVSLFHFAHFTNPRFLMGDLLALASAAGYAAVLVLTRATRQAGLPLLGTLFVAWVVAAILVSVVALLFGTLSISAGALLWVLGLALLCTNLPFYLLSQGMKEVPAGMASLLSMAEVVFATLLGVLLYREQLAPIGWMGGILVTIGIIYPFYRPSPAASAPGEAVLPLSDPATALRRWLRLSICLLLLNVGAFLAIFHGLGVGALLSWLGAAGLIRLGPPALIQLLDGQLAPLTRWVPALLASVLIVGVLFRGGWSSGAPGLLAAAVAFAALLGDIVLSGGESAPDADDASPLRMGLILLAASQLAGLAGHPAGIWLLVAAAAFAAVTAWSTLSGAVRGGDQWWREGRDLDGLAARLQRPLPLCGAALLIWLLGGVSQVPAGHHAVIERLGAALSEPARAGLLVRLPPPVERINLVDVSQVRRLEIVTSNTPLLCGDQSMVSLSASLHYTVTDAHQYLYAAIDPDAVLQDEARAALTSVIGRLPQNAVLTDQRASVEAAVLELTRARVSLAGLGVAPAALHLTTVAVPAPVMDAFLDVISADEERSTLINQAEAYAASLLPEALGEAAAMHQEALGAVDLIKADGIGWVAVFTALSEGGAAAPGLTRHRLRQEDMARSLADRPLVLVPPGLDVWSGGSAPALPDNGSTDAK